jgi:hypothetical protein
MYTIIHLFRYNSQILYGAIILDFSPDFIMMIQTRRIRSVGHLAHTDQITNI